MVDSGVITEAEAQVHPERNKICITASGGFASTGS